MAVSNIINAPDKAFKLKGLALLSSESSGAFFKPPLPEEVPDEAGAGSGLG